MLQQIVEIDGIRAQQGSLISRKSSLDDPADFRVRVFVEERPGAAPDRLMPGWASRVWSQRLWVPVLRYDEGYGATYGVQAAL